MSYIAEGDNYVIADPRPAEAWYSAFVSIINANGWRGDLAAKRQHALEWAYGVSETASLRVWRGWKDFKKAIAANWFGEPEHKTFYPDWDVEEVCAFACAFRNRKVRASLFPENIACHAESFVLPRTPAAVRRRLQSIDRSVMMDVFPESSTPTSICFRWHGDCFGDAVVMEAGIGQAMQVFESEQGQYALARRMFSNGELTLQKREIRSCDGEAVWEITRQLDTLVRKYGWYLQAQVFGICRAMGIHWLALEGYYDSYTDTLTVVDVDLPFDPLFMSK